MDHQELFDLVCKPQLDAIQQGQEEIIRILKGADGAAGLCARVQAVEKTMVEVTEIHTTVYGKEDKPGLAGRVIDLEKSRAGVVKAMWALALAAIGEIAVWIRGWFVG